MKPNAGRQIARWVVIVLMVLSVAQIGYGLNLMKHGGQLPGIRQLIGGSFFFLIFYAVQWLLRN